MRNLLSSIAKVIFPTLIFISLVLIVLRFGTKPLMDVFVVSQKAGLRVEANPQASVLIDGKDVGRTPFESEDLTPKEYLVEVKSDKRSWQGYIKLNSGTLSVINRELTEAKTASSGETITLEKGEGVTIISSPDSGEVFIDGKSYGRTPVQVKDLAPGEHLFLISKSNFLSRSRRAVLKDGYHMTLKIDLAISEVDLTQIPTAPIKTNPKVTVKQTPTGFLRIRETPSLSGKEVGRVSPGEELVLLEEEGAWSKVRLEDDKEGYVSSEYIQKPLN